MVDEVTEVGKGAEAFLSLVDVVTEVGKGAEALLLLVVVVVAAAHAKAPNPMSTSLIHLRSLHLHERSFLGNEENGDATKNTGVSVQLSSRTPLSLIYFACSPNVFSFATYSTYLSVTQSLPALCSQLMKL